MNGIGIGQGHGYKRGLAVGASGSFRVTDTSACAITNWASLVT